MVIVNLKKQIILDPEETVMYKPRQMSDRELCGKTSKNVKLFTEMYDIEHYTVKGCEKLTAEQCWNRYNTVNDFFIRKRIGLPEPKKQRNNLVSPVDNYCSIHSMNTTGGYVIKNTYYSLTNIFKKRMLPNYSLAIFRLTPRHYHGIHSPIYGKVLSMWYIIPTSKTSDRLTGNVRLVLELVNMHGDIIYMSLIGTSCVGSIQITHPAILASLNIKSLMANTIQSTVTFKTPPVIFANDELGNFQLGGSTVAMAIPPEYKLTKIGKIIKTNSLEGLETDINLGQVIFKRI